MNMFNAPDYLHNTYSFSSLFAFFNNLALLGTLLSTLKRECIWIKNNIDVIISTYCTQPVCPTLHMTKDQDRGKSKINRLCDKLGELGMEVIYNISLLSLPPGGHLLEQRPLVAWSLVSHLLGPAPGLISPDINHSLLTWSLLQCGAGERQARLIWNRAPLPPTNISLLLGWYSFNWKFSFINLKLEIILKERVVFSAT